ncbi:LysR family transcriptional regulator [Caldimonas aquatica]|uniref:LysR family transcriptional regulator n=1 Tax=Caldimonas aquatica TaxID=376175 RepID=A0ABY6MVJ8_9BURK|nr:LysR family transcriptional regulator [Schlegelella aquatica]UZD56030.1 LysR family transcriptional regulator [Schlegelella aquatica]
MAASSLPLAIPAMRFDLVTLNLVLAIAETRSITAGAAREHLALAAASRRLSDIETRLGVKLFERRARGVEPTEAGHALVRHIRSLRASLHALESEVVEFSRGVKGHLRVAANAASIAETLPRDLAAFSRANAGVRVSLEDLSSAEVQQAVAEGRADVGIFVAPVRDGLDLAVHDYRRGRLAVLVPRAHPLGRRKAVRFEALLDHDIVGLPIGTSVHEAMLAHAERQGRMLRARLQVRGFDAIAQLVEAGLGVAVLPATVADRLARLFEVKVLGLDEPWAERQYLIAVRRQEVQPAAVQRFLDALCGPSAGAATSRNARQSPSGGSKS